MPAAKPIKGVTAATLALAWTEVRQEIRGYSFRDSIDYLEYDVEPKIWIKRLLAQLRSGTYRPGRPSFAKAAKSKGFTRTLAYPTIPDLTLYRCLANELYRVAKRRELKHAYFEQSALSKAQKRAISEAKPSYTKNEEWLALFDEWFLEYRSRKPARYRTWLKYHQYRKHLIFSRIYPFIVVSDISNYFDSLLHTHIVDTLGTYIKDLRYIRLVELLLQTFSHRMSPRPSDGIGLPVDEADASRRIAHVLLFPHDERVSDFVGSGSYVRWMDDQNFGARTKEEALEIVGSIQSSLYTNNLFTNSGKTKVLTTSEAKKYFHFDSNDKFDKLYNLKPKTRKEFVSARASLVAAWSSALQLEDTGNWDKVLKRGYLLHTRFKSRKLRARSLRDLLRYPTLCNRILSYNRHISTTSEYLAFIDSVLSSIPKAYEDVAQAALDSLLLLEPSRSEKSTIRNIGSQLLANQHRCSSMPHCRSVAPLLFLRFGDRRQLPTLRKTIESHWDSESPLVIRSCALVYGSYGKKEMRETRKIAAKNFRNSIADQVLLFDKMASITKFPKGLSARFDKRGDGVSSFKYIDMRSMLTLRLLRVAGSKSVVKWCDSKISSWRSNASDFEKRLLLQLF